MANVCMVESHKWDANTPKLAIPQENKYTGNIIYITTLQIRLACEVLFWGTI